MGAYLFDGVDDSLDLGSALATATPITFGLWFRMGSATTAQRLVELGVVASTDDRFTMSARGDVTGNPLRVETRTTTSVTADTTSGYSVDTWHSACGVFASPASRAAYIDGGSKGTDTASRTPSGINRTRVGRNLANALPMAGHVGYVFVWSVALSDTEVADFHAGDIPQQASLAAAYDLTRDHGAGPIAPEIGSGSLTINGATFDASTTPPVLYFVDAPDATTLPATLVTDTSARLHAEVNPNGLETDAHFEWADNASFTSSQTTTPESVGDGDSAVAVHADLSSLDPETTYYFRVVAENSADETVGDTEQFTTLAEAPVEPVTYYVKIVAKDADGSADPSEQGSAFLVPINSEDISVDSVLARHIVADEAMFNKLRAVLIIANTLATADDGQRVEISTEGIELISSSGATLVRLPSDDGQPAFFRGDLEIQHADVLGRLNLRSDENLIDGGGKLTVAAGLSPPSTAPQLTRDWDSLALQASTPEIHGIFYDANGGAGGSTATFVTYVQGAAGNHRVREYNATTGAIIRESNPIANENWQLRGVARIGDHIWTMRWRAGEAAFDRWNRATLAHQTTVFPTVGDGAIGTDGTHLIRLVSIFGNLRIGRYNATTGAHISDTDTNVPWGAGGLGVAANSEGLWVAHRPNSGTAFATRISGSSAVANRRFHIASGYGLTWDGTRFYSNAGNDTLRKHSEWDWTDDDDLYHLAYTWRHTDGSETPPSPIASLSMEDYRRARIRISVPDIPGAANRVWVYAAQDNSGTPDPEDLKLQEPPDFTDTDEASLIRLSDFDDSGAAPPDTNDFPADNASISSATGAWEFKGDGTVTLPRAAAKVSRSTNQSLSNGVDTPIQFTTEAYDHGDLFSSGANTRLTAPSDGLYTITGAVRFATNTTGVRTVYIRRNGTGTLHLTRVNAGNVSVPVATTFVLVEDDYVELVAEQNSGGSLNAEDAQFTIARIP